MSAPVVLVTGGGRGIGRAVCGRFAATGAQVIAAARKPEELAETKRCIEACGGLCQVQPTDVTSAEAVQALVDLGVAKFGRLDTVINAAGVAPLVPVEALDPKIFDAIWAVNVCAVYGVCRAVWPIMQRQKGGVIVNISSVSAIDPYPGLEAYGASKAWVNAWTQSLAVAGRPHGIRAYAVAPGAVDTKMLRDIFPDYPAEQMLKPEDVAETVFAVAQPPFAYASGQVVYVRKAA